MCCGASPGRPWLLPHIWGALGHPLSLFGGWSQVKVTPYPPPPALFSGCSALSGGQNPPPGSAGPWIRDLGLVFGGGRDALSVCLSVLSVSLLPLQVLGDQVGFVVLGQVVGAHETFLALSALEAFVTCGGDTEGDTQGAATSWEGGDTPRDMSSFIPPHSSLRPLKFNSEFNLEIRANFMAKLSPKRSKLSQNYP